MKKLLFILVSTILLTSTIWSCKTKQVTTDKIQVEQTQNFDHLVLLDFIKKNQSTKELTESEKAEFKEILSNLNINYDGTDINDKLDVLLKKLADGTTQLTLQGKGTANYNQSDKTQLEAFQKYFKMYQDSIQEVNAKNHEQLKNDLFARIDEKNKHVKRKTFTWQVWLIIGLAVILGMFLSWVSKQFKPWLKAV